MTPPPPPGPPLVDPGNTFVQAGQLPATFTFGIANTTDGGKLVLTIRSAGTTLTLLIDKPNAIALGQQMIANADTIGGLVVPGLDVSKLSGLDGHG
jgi:hypothetical protein